MAKCLYITSSTDPEYEYSRRDINYIHRGGRTSSCQWTVRSLEPTTTFADVLSDPRPGVRDAICLVVAGEFDVNDAADFAAAVEEHRKLRYIVCDWPVSADFGQAVADRLGDLAMVVVRDKAASGVESFMEAMIALPPSHRGSMRALFKFMAMRDAPAAAAPERGAWA